MTARKPTIAILGSGLAGSMLANLLETAADVTVFERGTNRVAWPEEPKMVGRPLGLYPSFGYGLGGTTNLWRGGMVRMYAEEYGKAWPEAVRRELPTFERAVVRQLYGERAAAAWEQQPERQLTENAWLSTVFYPYQRFDNVLRMSGRTDLALRTAASSLCAASTLVYDARVDRIEETSAGVVVAWEDQGRARQKTFDFVIVSCGTMNSPHVLRQSGLGGPAVGQNFTDHPMGYVGKLVAPRNQEVFAQLSAKTFGFEDSKGTMKVRDPETGLWSVFNIRPAARCPIRTDPYARACKLAGKTTMLRRYFSALPGFFDRDFLYQAIENRTDKLVSSNVFYALIVHEQEATGQGSVRVGAGGRVEVDWRLSEALVGSIRRNFATLAELSGAEQMHPPGDLRARLWSAAHYCGTCRIAENPTDGVVDADLRVHGTERIFVCDASVAPSSGASAMGLTIGELAHRLARHLLARIQAPPGRSATPQPPVLVSGLTSHVGAMLKSRLCESPHDVQAVSLRPDAPGRPVESGTRVFLHLANAGGSVAENLELQRRALAAIEGTKVDQVILPLSFSTIGRLGERAPDPDALNYGFEITSPDPYPRGKLACEEFWLAWQKGAPNRKLLLLYIPTIVGEHSEWTTVRARHARDRKLLVPAMERFFTVTERDLTDAILVAFERGLDAPVTRRLMVTSSASLARSIGSDRDGALQEVTLPRVFWWLCRISERRGLVGKGVAVARSLTDKALRVVAGRAVVPVSAKYLHLFREQVRFADRVQDAVESTAGRPARS